MRWTKTFIPTLKETASDVEAASHKLMLRAGLIRQLSSGTYSYLPLGLRTLVKIEAIIRDEMNRAGGLEVLMPALQPAELWKKSGRYADLGQDMVSFIDRHQSEHILGPTHEEVITDLIRREIKSYRQLPLLLYQIQTKFRDEMRPRFGVIRSKEFIMKDAYSFHADETDLDRCYDEMFKTYCRIFDRCGLKHIIVEAASGIMGGHVSHEFMVLSERGEDTVIHCPACGYAAALAEALKPGAQGKDKNLCPKCRKESHKSQAIEIGHIFKLGTKYSEALEARFLDKEGREQALIMGCYGLGLNRIMAALIEAGHDKDGIIWPAAVSPYQALILPLETEGEIAEYAQKLYTQMQSAGLDVLLDDRDERPGIKFKDADLLGIPLRITIGTRTLGQGKVELRSRKDKETVLVEKGEVLAQIKTLVIN